MILKKALCLSRDSQRADIQKNTLLNRLTEVDYEAFALVSRLVFSFL